MKKTNKIIKSSIKSKPKPKTDSEWEEYLNTISLQLAPATTEGIKRLSIELVTWSRENAKAYVISQFYNMKGIPEKTYYRWVDKHPILKEAHDIALSIITDRRELYLIERDPSSVRYMMPQYSKKWLAEDERRNKQKQLENSGITKAIIMGDSILNNKKDK